VLTLQECLIGDYHSFLVVGKKTVNGLVRPNLVNRLTTGSMISLISPDMQLMSLHLHSYQQAKNSLFLARWQPMLTILVGTKVQIMMLPTIGMVHNTSSLHSVSDRPVGLSPKEALQSLPSLTTRITQMSTLKIFTITSKL
jgi:hypothetical protein